jgi:hypothetical protein
MSSVKPVATAKNSSTKPKARKAKKEGKEEKIATLGKGRKRE